MREKRALVASLCLLSAATTSALAQFHEFTQNGFQVQRLAMRGDPAPGMPEGVTVVDVGYETSGENGGVAFNALLRGPGVTPDVNSIVLYTLRAGQLVPVVRTGDVAPGLTPPTAFDSPFYTEAVNGSGDVTFDCHGFTDPMPFGGAWIYRDGVQLLAAAGTPAPGTNGLVFKGLVGYQEISESRHVAFMAAAGPPGDTTQSSGLWSDRSGTLQRIYDADDPAPGNLSNLKLGGPWLRAMTPDDRVTFTTHLSGPDVTWRNDQAVFAERDGQLKLIAREGDPAPGTDPGVILAPDSMEVLRVTADGLVGFRGGLMGPNVTPDNLGGIWSEASGELRLVAREDDPVPMAGEGVRLAGFSAVAPALNAYGRTVFRAALRGPGALGNFDESIWLDDNGTKTLLARLGDHAPGFGPDTHFVDFEYGALSINNPGDIIFEGQVYGPDALRSPQGLWLWHDGVTQLLMQQDGYFDGQLVSGFYTYELNNLGQVFLYAVLAGPDGIQDTYDDQSAFYLITIPEPAMVLLLGLAGALFSRRRR